MTSKAGTQPSENACTACFSLMGVAGRRLRMGQWHADAEGTPLVLLGGLGMNMEMLEPVARAMPDRRLISVDMPGIGLSPDPIFPYSMPDMALALAATLDRLEIDAADVLGISWGGALAQQFALQYTARTRHLVLAATSAGGVMMPGNPALPAHWLDPTEYSVEAALRRNLATLYNGGGSGQLSLNAAKAPSPLGWAYQLSAFATWSSAAFLPMLSMPVLIMADADDQLIPVTNAHFLHHAIPGSQIVLFKGGGHLFMLSHPQAFVEKLVHFLR